MEYFKIISYAVPMLAASCVLISPAKFGLQTGNINREGKHLFVVTFTTLLLFVIGGILVMKFILHKNPYSGAGYEVVIISPVIEELIFRGILFYILSNLVNKCLKSKYNVLVIIAINSILFAAMHFLHLLDPHFSTLFVIIQVVQSFLLGLVYCYLRYKSDSLYPSIFLHFMWNFIAVNL